MAFLIMLRGHSIKRRRIGGVHLERRKRVPREIISGAIAAFPGNCTYAVILGLDEVYPLDRKSFSPEICLALAVQFLANTIQMKEPSNVVASFCGPQSLFKSGPGQKIELVRHKNAKCEYN